MSESQIKLPRGGVQTSYVHSSINIYIPHRWWFNCVSVCPLTCRHIARRMMNGYVGYHDANNVSILVMTR